MSIIRRNPSVIIFSFIIFNIEFDAVYINWKMVDEYFNDYRITIKYSTEYYFSSASTQRSGSGNNLFAGSRVCSLRTRTSIFKHRPVRCSKISYAYTGTRLGSPLPQHRHKNVSSFYNGRSKMYVLPVAPNRYYANNIAD